VSDERWHARLEALLAEIRVEFPGFRIVPKRDSALSKAIDLALRVVTLGRQREYMTRYHTVLGDTLYVPEAWERTPPLRRIVTLRHERVHLRQRRRYGDLVMSFLYLVPFLPLGLAWGRARIEWEAYAETVRATAELEGVEAARSAELRRHVVSQFTSGAYGWMWPFPAAIDKWYDRVLQGLDDGARTEGPKGDLAAPTTQPQGLS
jgi:hypothetical protein